MAYPGSLLHSLSQASKKEAARVGSHPRAWLGQNLPLSLHVSAGFSPSMATGPTASVPYWLEGHPQFPTGWKAILSSLLAGRPSSVLCLVGVSSMVAVLSECTSPEGNEVRKMKSQCFVNLTTSHYLCLILLVGNNSQGPVYPKEGMITQEWDTRKQGSRGAIHRSLPTTGYV